MNLEGMTAIRFGPFEALTSGKTIEETNTDPVWKVWFVHPEGQPLRIAKDLKRDQAVEAARNMADTWRTLGKPALVEHREFVCPMCGGREFGTSRLIASGAEEGYCYGRNERSCSFTWKRSEDSKYLKGTGTYSLSMGLAVTTPR